MAAPAARILVIEDNALLRAQLQRLFADAGMAVEFASDGLAGLQMALDAPPDVLVLDVGLPGLDGLRLCERLRTHADRHVPVLMLTARDALEDKLQGFRAGADDYLVKPFDVAELKARLRALLRRSFQRPQPALEYRGISLDPASQVVEYQGQVINLPRKEFLLLHELLIQPGRVLTRDKLQQALYGWDEEVESNALEVHVHHLRKKFFPELIRTVRGVGYLVDK